MFDSRSTLSAHVVPFAGCGVAAAAWTELLFPRTSGLGDDATDAVTRLLAFREDALCKMQTASSMTRECQEITEFLAFSCRSRNGRDGSILEC
jgi:hypothetical protein